MPTFFEKKSWFFISLNYWRLCVGLSFDSIDICSCNIKNKCEKVLGVVKSFARLSICELLGFLFYFFKVTSVRIEARYLDVVLLSPVSVGIFQLSSVLKLSPWPLDLHPPQPKPSSTLSRHLLSRCCFETCPLTGPSPHSPSSAWYGPLTEHQRTENQPKGSPMHVKMDVGINEQTNQSISPLITIIIICFFSSNWGTLIQ